MRTLVLALGLAVAAHPAWAADARPAGHPAAETSVVKPAPAAGPANPGGASDQGQAIGKMNEAERKKVDATGK